MSRIEFLRVQKYLLVFGTQFYCLKLLVECRNLKISAVHLPRLNRLTVGSTKVLTMVFPKMEILLRYLVVANWASDFALGKTKPLTTVWNVPSSHSRPPLNNAFSGVWPMHMLNIWMPSSSSGVKKISHLWKINVPYAWKVRSGFFMKIHDRTFGAAVMLMTLRPTVMSFMPVIIL